MDAIDLLILALRIVLVALLYLFLVTVMRTASRTLRAPAEPVVAPAAASPRVGQGEASAGLRLTVVHAAAAPLSAGQVLEVDDGALLGRAERSDVVLADPTVSSEHARLNRVGRAWVVSDLGSTNGTRVNGARVERDMPIAPGDVLALGSVQLKVGTRPASRVVHT